MADDPAYADFLDKANQDTSAPKTKQASHKHPSLESSSVDDEKAIPASLKKIDAVYVSDSDSDFEPVSLAIPGKKLTTDVIRELFQLSDDIKVDELKTSEWDPREQYKEVVEKVEKVTHGGAKVYRAAVSGTRVLYLVLGVEKNGDRILGVKTIGIES